MTSTQQQDTDRDQLVADKRALGSITASLDQDAERVQRKVEELREAIERLNARYVSAHARLSAIKAAGEDPGPVATPMRLIGVIELPAPMEHPPRKRISLRRSAAQLEREAEKRKREAEEFERNVQALPNVANLPLNVPLASL